MKYPYRLKTISIRWACVSVLLIGCQLGCRQADWRFWNAAAVPSSFAERIIPQQPCSRVRAASTESLLDRSKSANPPNPAPEVVRLPVSTADTVLPSTPCEERLCMAEAIDISQSKNPVLAEAKARIGMARAGKKIAFAAFLPELYAATSLVATGGDIRSLQGSNIPGITLPITWQSNFNRTELKAQWTIWDFGRRLGVYRQSDIMVQIAGLQYQRACQTVAYDVSESYYKVLQAHSSVVTARDALRRGNEYLRVSLNLLEQGEVDRESVFAAQLLVARAEQQCVSAETGVNTSTAELNKAMGRNTAWPTRVQNVSCSPNFQKSLLECLERAVQNRREIYIVGDWVAKASQAKATAKADFMPRVLSRAKYNTLSGDAKSDSKVGMIVFEWDVFSGGKRIGKLREEKAAVCEAIANAKKVCDQIAYEVNVSYQHVEDAQQRISLAKSAVRFSRERLRIVMNKFIQGEASPTDVIDAQTSMTRAQQTYHTTVYQFQSAKARLEYAMGTNLNYGESFTGTVPIFAAKSVKMGLSPSCRKGVGRGQAPFSAKAAEKRASPRPVNGYDYGEFVTLATLPPIEK